MCISDKSKEIFPHRTDGKYYPRTKLMFSSEKSHLLICCSCNEIPCSITFRHIHIPAECLLKLLHCCLSVYKFTYLPSAC